MPEIPAWLTAAATFLGFIVGGGTIGKWVAARLQAGAEADRVERFARKFATVDVVNGWSEKLTREIASADERNRTAVLAAEERGRMAEEGAKLAINNADKALDEARDLRAVVNGLAERMMREFFEPFKEMAREQREMGKQMAAQTALLERLTEEWDRDRKR